MAAAKTFEAVPHRTREPTHHDWTVSRCDDRRFAEDLEDIVARSGLATSRLIQLHARATYRVYMYGFALGFCYLGDCQRSFRFPVGRPRVPHIR